ncbi:MAG: type VI secretion system tube protein Hcp [Chitinophagaceae bacterium]|nr:type VI secretion system tube protein Hcp [Chitinophagaceae bacterium]
MRKIIFLLLLIPSISFAQKQTTYAKLINASGVQIKGDAVTKGFERWITALSNSNGGKNNTEVTFTMNISGACADLRNANTNGEILQKGELSTIQIGATDGRPNVIKTIKMENIRVISFSETGTEAAVTLSATRIGWIYYQQTTKGTWTVANKTSYDASTGGYWKDF